MSDKVIRFGGSHLNDIKSIKNLCAFSRKDGGRAFIVVSAAPGILETIGRGLARVFSARPADAVSQLENIFREITGQEPTGRYRELSGACGNLFRGIALTGDYSNALRDQVKSFSEKLTAELLRFRLQEAGISGALLFPEEIRLRVTSDYGNATYLSVDAEEIEELPNGFYLVPGSYGVTGSGKPARAGETAADYTAAFLAYSLGVEKLDLWGLDSDFRRADRAIVPGSPRIGQLTYAEASELAYFDHYSLHPRTVEPLEAEHIPVVVADTRTGAGTAATIINTETSVEPQVVKSVACSDDISLLRLSGPGVGLKPGILAKITFLLKEAGINIKSVITSQISINLILGKKDGKKALQMVQQPGFPSVRELSVVEDVSLIGIVGHGMQQNYGVSARIFSAVSQNRINVLLSGSGVSDLVSYLVVREKDKVRSVRAVYDAFFSPPAYAGREPEFMPAVDRKADIH